MNFLFLTTACALLCACAPDRADEAAEVSPDTTPAIQQSAPTGFVVHPRGTPSIRIGMSYSELAPLMTDPNDTTRAGDGCDYVSIKDAPDSVSFMVEGRKLVRIGLTGTKSQTQEGGKVGQTEAEIQKLYPAARRAPHKYVAGSYFIVLPYAPGDTLHRYVFETDGQHVVMVRAGVYPQVEYVEGCG